jgi:hypothetical protein
MMVCAWLAVVSVGQFISNAQATKEACSVGIIHANIHSCNMVFVEETE